MLRFERWQVKWWNKPSPQNPLASNTPGYAWLACGSPRSPGAVAFRHAVAELAGWKVDGCIRRATSVIQSGVSAVASL